MTTLRAAAQQALEALEYAEENHGGDDCYADTITALRAALAEPVQEPVAVVRSVVGPGDDGVRVKWLGGFPQIGDRLYTSPPQRKPLTEEEIQRIFRTSGSPTAFARAVIDAATGKTE